MKLKLLSTLIAASFLAGCSSSGSSNSGGTEPGPSPQDGIADVNYHQGNEFDAALITGDAGDYNALVIRDQSSTNGEITTHIIVDGNIYSVSDGLVSDTQGNEVGHIQNQGDQVVFNGVIKGEKVEVTLTVVDGRLIADSTVIETPPKWGDEGATSISIVEEGESTLIYLGDQHIGTINELGTVIKDGKAIGEFEGDKGNGSINFYDGSAVTYQSLNTGTGDTQTIVTLHKDGMIYTWNSTTGEKTASIDESIDHDWGNTDPDFENGKLIKTAYRADYRDGEIIYAKGYNDGELIILLNVDGKKFQITANDTLKENIGDVINDRIGNIDPEFGLDIDNLPSSEFKQKIQSLSQEQRQQIKQAVKDRASRS
ncbi:hypothetical protein BCT96_000195 [Vibrio splendidus]|uniref:hypothetical protein n=1 Tax=Vibrio splendidus TaxID=29497 RepID=UPI000CADB61D|nr:hypothetical protein [Vibrio splendidus]PMI83971.1 hypothetical protein BCU37_13095 [Vibrio splendidus]PMK60805.1 hypothetical protein BCT96_01030 [Vibrio splendidus]